MKNIEFIGKRNIGKSFLFRGIVKKKKIHNFISVFYCWLYKNKVIGSVSYFIILKLVLSEATDFKKKGLFNLLVKKLYFFLIKGHNSTKEKLQKKIVVKYDKFFSKLSKIFKNDKDFRRINKWLIDFLIGFELSKKLNVRIISSEGIAQRIYSICLRKRISNKNLKAIISMLPKPSYLIYIFKKKEKNALLDRIIKVYSNQKVKLILIKNSMDLYDKNLKKIISIYEK